MNKKVYSSSEIPDGCPMILPDSMIDQLGYKKVCGDCDGQPKCRNYANENRQLSHITWQIPV